MKIMNKDIVAYNTQQIGENKKICELLATKINTSLENASSKIYHRAPVWFINDNPVVGYWVRKNHVQLLFWSGQSFDEPSLTAEGKFKAAQAHYASADQIDIVSLERWLEKSIAIQWDYKNIVKRRGELIRIK
jgi:hypothetical protein